MYDTEAHKQTPLGLVSCVGVDLLEVRQNQTTRRKYSSRDAIDKNSQHIRVGRLSVHTSLFHVLLSIPAISSHFFKSEL